MSDRPDWDNQFRETEGERNARLRFKRQLKYDKERRTITAEIIRANLAHPDWGYAEIAAHVGTVETMVRNVANRKRLTVAPRKSLRIKRLSEPRPFRRAKYAGAP